MLSYAKHLQTDALHRNIRLPSSHPALGTEDGDGGLSSKEKCWDEL